MDPTVSGPPPCDWCDGEGDVDPVVLAEALGLAFPIAYRPIDSKGTE